MLDDLENQTVSDLMIQLRLEYNGLSKLLRKSDAKVSARMRDKTSNISKLASAIHHRISFGYAEDKDLTQIKTLHQAMESSRKG